MATFEWMICLDPGGNAEGPEFDGPKDERVWSLYANSDRSPERPEERAQSGSHFGELGMYRYQNSVPYASALALADFLGFEGNPIGG